LVQWFQSRRLKTDNTLFDTFVPLDSFVYLRTTTKNIPFFKNYPMNIPIILVATGTVVSEKKIKTDNTLFDTFEPLVSFVYL
jgi:hypothetical protein